MKPQPMSATLSAWAQATVIQPCHHAGDRLDDPEVVVQFGFGQSIGAIGGRRCARWRSRHRPHGRLWRSRSHRGRLGDIAHALVAGRRHGYILSPSLQVAMSHEQMPQTPPLSWISPGPGSGTRCRSGRYCRRCCNGWSGLALGVPLNCGVGSNRFLDDLVGRSATVAPVNCTISCGQPLTGCCIPIDLSGR